MKKYFFLSVLLAGLLMYMQVSEAEFSAVLKQEWAIDDRANGQKFEVLFEPEWNLSLSDNLDMTIIGRVRWDGMDKLGSLTDNTKNFSSINHALLSGSDGDVSIREWYVDTEAFGAFWRIGKQQVVWGQADGLKVLDVVNPQSFREFILGDFANSRIPLWMLNVELPIKEAGSLQLLWIPDSSYNELAQANTSYELSSSLLVPQLADGQILTAFNRRKPSSIFSDSDFGLRYSTFYSGWDLTFNYMYHYLDSPVLYQNVIEQGLIIDSEYERSHLIGASASNAFGDFTLRTEVGYSTDTFNLSTDLNQSGITKSADLSSVIGLDWQGLDDTLISIQWFYSHLFDYDNHVIRSQDNHILSFLYKQTFQNETWELEVLELHGLDKDDGSIQVSVNYMLTSNVKAWIGTDVFYGNKTGLFGQFKNTDRITVGFEWGL
ncbi:MAG: hypothetical protein JKY19_01955 [Alcanivoracaceae bacterium]|nr:hypothetical protein [Alcanivoracaceae bacterium]